MFFFNFLIFLFFCNTLSHPHISVLSSYFHSYPYQFFFLFFFLRRRDQSIRDRTASVPSPRNKKPTNTCARAPPKLFVGLRPVKVKYYDRPKNVSKKIPPRTRAHITTDLVCYSVLFALFVGQRQRSAGHGSCLRNNTCTTTEQYLYYLRLAVFVRDIDPAYGTILILLTEQYLHYLRLTELVRNQDSTWPETTLTNLFFFFVCLFTIHQTKTARLQIDPNQPLFTFFCIFSLSIFQLYFYFS